MMEVTLTKCMLFDFLVKTNLSGVLSSDGSDDGGSDLYGSDPDKYDNMEAFDMDHQVI